jgi:polysaccharide deacetylase 2 family uncharacterized protein YibQ
MPRKRKKKFYRILDAALPAALLVLFLLIGYILFLSPHKGHEKTAPEPASVTSPAPVTERVPAKPPMQEHSIKHDPAVPGPRAVRKPPPDVQYKARVAIVIDDLGSDMASLEGVLGIDAPLAVAVLPGLPYSGRSARTASAAGRDVLLHLPMQPKGDSMKGLGPGALMMGMDGNSIAGTVEADLSGVPGVVGVNNHMGSYLTEDAASMDSVMEVIGRHGLFFLDSRTSSGSVALKTARRHGVPAASRNVFLDDADDEVEIRKQFARMEAMALKKGEAIAIGHPRPATLRVLREELPGLKQKGIEVVKVSRLMR